MILKAVHKYICIYLYLCTKTPYTPQINEMLTSKSAEFLPIFPKKRPFLQISVTFRAFSRRKSQLTNQLIHQLTKSPVANSLRAFVSSW